jgi:mannose-1-phosphate guanylyltransferase
MMSDASGRTSRRITPVILCGGSGTRLWPLSRRARPKQMLALTAAGTMLQMTAARVSDRDRFEAPLVIAGAEQAESAVRQLDEAGIAAGALIVEPVGRNTAPAIALAASSLARDNLMLVMPSDHLIGDPARFIAAVEAAAAVAEAGWLVTFGVQPDRPETGYGYIRRGDQIEPGVFRAERFVEKPDAATAQLYLDQGCYDWNGGIFMFRAGRYLDALRRFAPAIFEAVSAAMDRARPAGADIRPDPDSFASSPSVSIDYAVMERDDRVAVVPVEMGWSDIGSWDALHAVREADARDNVAKGPVTLVDSDNCLVHSAGTRVVALGVRDLIVVVAEDAVLVLPRGQSQRVKEALEQVRK